MRKESLQKNNLTEKRKKNYMICEMRMHYELSRAKSLFKWRGPQSKGATFFKESSYSCFSQDFQYFGMDNQSVHLHVRNDFLSISALNLENFQRSELFLPPTMLKRLQGAEQ